MSNDENKPNAEDANEPARQSPVIARDVAADPSAKASDKDAGKKDSEKVASPTKPVSSLADKLKATKFQEEHPDPVVTQQGVSPQDDPEEEDGPQDAAEDATPQDEQPEEEAAAEEKVSEDVSSREEEVAGEDEEDEEDLGVFLEEIFPDGDELPAFSMPGAAIQDDESDDEEEASEPAEEPEAADDSSTEVRGSSTPEQEKEAEPAEDDPESAPEADEALDTPSREDFFSEVIDDEVDDAPPAEEIEEYEVPASVHGEDNDEVITPIPAVALSPEASPAAPLDTDGLPISERDVRGLLERIGGLAKSCNMTSLSKEIHQERLPTLDGGRVTLVVLGEFNHGKSTVINALLGDEVLPMGITPTTAVITHLVHAERPVVTIQPAHHGTPYTIDYDEMEEAVKESGAEGEEPEYVEIGFPNDVLGNSLVLVDTPGVNDISRQKVEITYGYLPRADVILYVLDATQVLKKSEVTFIKDRLLKSSSDRIIFVLNKIDALDPEDIEEVVEYARERLTAILGPVELFTFSGRKALKAQMSDEPIPEEFAHFQRYLQHFLQEQRAFIILDSALSSGLRVSTLMEQNLAIKRQGYQLERDDLEQRIAAVRSRLKESRRLIAENTQLIDSRVQGIAATAKHNLRIFTEQFAEQLPLQIERADASDVKKFLPTWIQETYKEWLEKEGSALARSLEELAEEIIQITNESLQQTVQSYQDEFGLSGELDLSVDTVAYDVGVFALGAFGVSIFLFANVIVGSLLTLATPVLAYFFKEKVETRIKERAREQGAEAIKAASEKLEEELLRVIHGYGDRLKEFVEMAGDRLYRQIEEALQQVQQETSGDYDREELLATVTAHLKSIQLIQDELHGARKQLEDWATSQDFN